MEMMGIEPMSEDPSIPGATIISGILVSRHQAPAGGVLLR